MSGHELGPNIDRFLEDRDHALASLQAYFHTSDYTGRLFDRVGGGSAPNAVTPDDLVALALLAVPVGNQAAEALLYTQAKKIGALLAEISVGLLVT